MSSAVMRLSSESGNQPSSAGGSPASLTVLQENVRHLVTTVISRENLKESFGRLNPDGSLLRMSQGSVQANLEGFLETSFMIFPKWGIVSGGVAGELLTLEPVTEGNGSSLLLTPSATNIEGGPDRYQKRTEYRKSVGRKWVAGSLAEQIATIPTPRSRESGNYQYANGNHETPTPTLSGVIAMLPTLRANDNDQENHEAIQKAGTSWKGQNRGSTVSTAIAMLPTCTSRDHKGGTVERVEDGNPKRALDCEMQVHGLKLQPAFAEWMMGFPGGWTALDASEMPSSRNKFTRSSKPSQMLKKERKNP